jgi:hypothetical protein
MARLIGSVGRLHGRNSRNYVSDQKVVQDLLNKIPSNIGGAGGSLNERMVEGIVSQKLYMAILRFQQKYVPQFADGHVDPNGATFNEMERMANFSNGMATFQKGVKAVEQTATARNNAVISPQSVAPFSAGPIRGDLKDPVSIRNWVLENVPCFQGPVPKELTQAVYAKLRQWHVSPRVISLGLALTRRDGYVFYYDSDAYIRPHVDVGGRDVNGNYYPPGDKMSADVSDRRQRNIATMEMLNAKYEQAMFTHNSKDMQRIAQNFADLLNAASPSNQKYSGAHRFYGER